MEFPPEIPTKLMISFQSEKGFIRRASGPFFHTYVRGKIVITLDPEGPTYDIGHAKEDMDCQMLLEQSTEDKFLSELMAFVARYYRRQ